MAKGKSVARNQTKGLRLLLGATLLFAAGCASTAGWGPAAPMPANATVPAQQGAPRFVQTTGMRLTAAEKEVEVPPWIRVQDCAIVAISSPARWACPDGKVYTSFELSRARTREYVVVAARQPAIVLTPYTPQPSSPEPAEKIVLRGVHFDFNRAEIRPQDGAVLDEAAETLKSHPNVSVAVNGYCDSIGGVKYNLRLSQRRADAVVKYLSDHGVAESRLSAQGFGKTDFVASNSTDEGRAQNRRVELEPNQGQSGRVFIMGVPGNQ
jgi:outer membrane protein OmpA-like peptidoglycan-associated protein